MDKLNTTYNPLDHTFQNESQIIRLIRQGIQYSYFFKILQGGLFGFKDWSRFLHLSERTLQRYRKEQKTFEPIYAERIIEIALLQKKGAEVFGDAKLFHQWLTSENIALGGIHPKELLDNTFGINMLKDALIRIEHGVLA